MSSVLDKLQELDNKKLGFIVICLSRLIHGLIYWYYTKGSKINGCLLVRRTIPPISDPLKFTIALDFMKKCDYRKCMKYLCEARSTLAFEECFHYLFYGRALILKNLMYYRKKLIFYTLSLDKVGNKNFLITKEKPYFQDL